MSNDKFTPGPWRVNIRSLLYRSDETFYVATANFMRNGFGFSSKETAEANAKLISKAWLIPELETALINLLEHREGTVEGDKARKEAELLIQKIRE